MRLGLSKEQIDQILKENGIAKGEDILASTIRNAISAAIEENNTTIEKNLDKYMDYIISQKRRLEF